MAAVESFLEGDKAELLVLPKVCSPIQIVAQDLSRVGARAGITAGATDWTLCVQLVLGKKDG